MHWQEPARQIVRSLAGTPAYICSQRLGLRRVRLRRLWNVAEQFFLAATAENLKRLVRFLAQRQSLPALSTT